MSISSISVTLTISEESSTGSELPAEGFDFDRRATAEAVCRKVLETEGCPFDAEISLTYTDSDTIHEINREYRGIDRATDVLSFPNISFSLEEDEDGETSGVPEEEDNGTAADGTKGDAQSLEAGGRYRYTGEDGTVIVPSSWERLQNDPELRAECMDPDTGRLFLGDIVLNLDRVLSQAAEYGHSVQREFAFLIAHSMLHLCGYDHMTEDESSVMFGRQEGVLRALGITRDPSENTDEEV